MADEFRKTFFSYARADSEFVLRLVKDLRAAGADVWLDQLDIGPGERWDSAVENALRTCHRHVTVLSPEAVSSQNVMDEVSYALEEHKQVIPLLYRDCIVPFRLRRVQWVDFRTDYTIGFKNLAKALGIKDAQLVRAQPMAEIDGPETSLQVGIQAVAAAQTARVAEQPLSEVSTGEEASAQAAGQQVADQQAQDQEKGRRKVEQAGAAARQLGISPEPKPKEKILWTVAAVVVVLTFVIWMLSAGNAQHDSGTGQAITPTVTATPDDSQAAASDAETFYERGVGSYNQKQYDQAIDAFDNAIRLKPDYAEAFEVRGEAHFQKGQYDLAIKDYDEAIALRPDYEEAIVSRGLAHALKHQYDQAIQDYNEGLRLNPKNDMALSFRGWAYENKGQYTRAIQDYDEALRLNPTDTFTLDRRKKALASSNNMPRSSNP